MADFNDWRLLREELTSRGYLQTDLTDEPLDDALVDASGRFIEDKASDAVQYEDWDGARKAICALQLVAAQAGVYDGELDGLAGPATRHALEVMEYRLANAGAVDQVPEEVSTRNPETARDAQDVIARNREPASIRYYNPGAMYPGPSSKKFGSTRTEVIGGGHLIAVFPDDESGAAAMFDLLDRGYTGMSMRAAIAKWCGGNSAAAYSQRVSKETGVDPDEVLTHEMVHDPVFAVSLCRAMSQVEAGKPYPLDDSQWAAAHARAFPGEAPAVIAPPDEKLAARSVRDWFPKMPWVIPATDKPKDQVPIEPPPEKIVWPRQSEVPDFYGEPGTRQVRLQSPWPLRLAWDLNKTVTSFSVHEKVHDSALRVMTAVLAHYGEDEVKRLRLDLFGGSLNVRKMTGGSNMSMHSWGIALDFDPDHNEFSMGRDRAAFARPEYAPWLDAWEAEGWLSLGRARNKDWMHVQAARL